MKSRTLALSALAASLLLVGCPGGGGVGDPMISTTIAGGATPGNADGPGATATFNNPVNCALGSGGNLYVCDFDNGRVRRVNRSSVVSTVVNQANFSHPFGICFVGDQLYVQTDANDTGGRDGTTGTIWRVDTAAGTATVVARNLGRPRGMVGLPDGRIAMTNLTRHTVQILDPATGTVTTIAGADGVSGFANGTGTAARFHRPYGLDLYGGDLLVADQNNHRIRRVTLAGVVTTFAGSGTQGFANGTRSTARFNSPQDVKVDALGNVFVADNGNHRLRGITADTVGVTAGDGTPGFRDGGLLETQFFGMEGFCISSDAKSIYVADGNGGDPGPYHRIRKLTIR